MTLGGHPANRDIAPCSLRMVSATLVVNHSIEFRSHLLFYMNSMGQAYTVIPYLLALLFGEIVSQAIIGLLSGECALSIDVKSHINCCQTSVRDIFSVDILIRIPKISISCIYFKIWYLCLRANSVLIFCRLNTLKGNNYFSCRRKSFWAEPYI